MTLGENLAFILDRDLTRLADQLKGYPDDDTVWAVLPGTLNSAGTLALHMVGNLEHYIGAALGDTGYVRDREAEFARRGVPRAELLRGIEEGRSAIIGTLRGLSNEELLAPFPGESPRGLGDETAHKFLLHLAAHFSWHLGQVDYHRRVLDARD